MVVIGVLSELSWQVVQVDPEIVVRVVDLQKRLVYAMK